MFTSKSPTVFELHAHKYHHVLYLSTRLVTNADWGKSLAPAAFVYRVDPSPELLAKILRMLQASLTFYQEILAEDNEPTVHGGAVGRENLDY